MPKQTAYRVNWYAPSVYLFSPVTNAEEKNWLLHHYDAFWPLLNDASSFSFRGLNGSCTVRKENKQRGTLYWYAYRRSHNKMFKQYVSRFKDISCTLLEDATTKLMTKIQSNSYTEIIQLNETVNSSPNEIERSTSEKKSPPFFLLLEELRTAKLLSKAELAQHADLTASYVTQLTRGYRHAPSERTVRALARALELDAETTQKLFVSARLRPES